MKNNFYKIIILSMFLYPTADLAQANDADNLCQNAPPPSANVSIPADDAIHVESDGTFTHQYEQWYWVAYMKGPAGKTYALETLVFQFNVFQPFIANIIQVALTDVDSGEHMNDITLSFGGPGYPFIPNGFDLNLVDQDTGAGLVAKGGAGQDNLVFTFSDGTVANIDFDGLKHATPAFYDGFGDYIDPVTAKNHGGQFYYNRRSMSTMGQITFPGEGPINVRGIGNYDRQWGTVIGTPGTQADNVNWKWFALTIFEHPSAPLKGASSANATNYVIWDMRANDTGNTLIHTVNKLGPAPQCEQELIEDWTVEGTGDTVFTPGPPLTTVDKNNIITIPSEGLVLTTIPLVDDQFVLSGGLFDPFYEGVVEVQGTRDGKPVSGYGYYEAFLSCCQGQ